MLRVGDLELDRVERKVRRAGKSVDLTSKEFGLLEYLMRNAGRRVTRAMIVEHVWNLRFNTTTNIVDVYINQVMQHLDNINEVGRGIAVAFVATVYGVGSANLFFLPSSGKLRIRICEEQICSGDEARKASSPFSRA